MPLEQSLKWRYASRTVFNGGIAQEQSLTAV